MVRIVDVCMFLAATKPRSPIAAIALPNSNTAIVMKIILIKKLRFEIGPPPARLVSNKKNFVCERNKHTYLIDRIGLIVFKSVLYC